ncbi:MAG TPA: class I SAM-dependent methyltransferase [Thermoanaerobaculia bacterium]|nr:class I SAM-dependent methyltransferase [Thermoanaerobaculia bacterium]
MIEGIRRRWREAWRGKDAGGSPPGEMERVFGEIYRSNAWGSGESVSGPGSTHERAADFRDDLAAVLRDLGTRVLLDAPCGDFNWIGPVADEAERYIGVDVVPELVERNARRHGSRRRRFLRLDLTRDELPRADVVLCRDCLVHLRTADIWRALESLRRSGARYLVVTTFIGERGNEEIETGAWRPLNLERPPFHFPPPLRLIDERCLHTGGIYADKRLGVWRMADVPLSPGE